MQPSALITFVVTSLIVASVFAVFAAIRYRTAGRAVVAGVCLLGLCFVVLIGGRMNPGANFATSLLQAVLSRDASTLASMIFGGASALPWSLLASRPAAPTRSRRYPFGAILTTVSLSGAVLAYVAIFLIFLARAEFSAPSFARLLWSDSIRQNGFSLRRLAVVGPVSAHPISLALDDDENVYVSYHVYFIGKEHGGVHKFMPNEDRTSARQETVVDSPILARPFGLAVRDGDLFVSRSGRLAFADEGEIRHEAAGAVTRIRDLDGDGYYEFMDDILVGLPGARGPDTQHQNQGIAFTADGRLLVTNGVPSDHAPATHAWEGVILELSPDFEDVSVFAEGFRNPFGITVTERGNVIATDNDSSSESGDEINHVRRGEHYGHPFNHDPSLEATGFVDPIHRGRHGSNYVGVVQVPSDYPVEDIRGALLVADHVRDLVWRVRIEEDDAGGVTFVDANPYFNVPAPLNIAVGASGTIYVLSYGIYSKSALYTITPR